MKCRTAFSIGDKIRIVKVLDPALNGRHVKAEGTITEIRFDKRGVFFHVDVPVTGEASILVVATQVGRIPKTSKKAPKEGVKPDAPKETPPVSSESVPAPASNMPHTSTATGNGIVSSSSSSAAVPKA